MKTKREFLSVKRWKVTCFDGHSSEHLYVRKDNIYDAILHAMGIYPGANEFKAEAA